MSVEDDEEPKHVYTTLPDRVTKLELDQIYDARELKKHLDQSIRDAAKAETDRKEILAAVHKNTEAINNANLAAKLVKWVIGAGMAGISIVYTIVKIAQEFVPPRTPLHAFAVAVLAAAMLSTAVDIAMGTEYRDEASSHHSLTYGPDSLGAFLLGADHASVGSSPGGTGWIDPRH